VKPCIDPLVADGSSDADGDTLSNVMEFNRGTDPCNPDSDGDNCVDGKETSIGFNPLDPWDFFDVPAPVKADALGANGVRDQAVSLADVIAVLRYVGTFAGDGGTPNANGLAYDTDKGLDANGDSVADIPPNGVPNGRDYDRTPSSPPNPPYEVGPPTGAVSLEDVIAALAQVGLDCRVAP
jgi:hypothetical protein